MLVKVRYFFIAAVIMLGHAGVDAQTLDEEVKDLMDKAVAQMNARDYKDANNTFRKMLASKKVLPTNMSYLFAETLFMVGQYHNSENFLDKYVDLAGKGGDYYAQAIDLKAAITKKKEEIEACTFCTVFGYRLKNCTVCNGEGHITSTCYYCKGLGKTNCLTCEGDGVIISTNIFDVKEYKSCHVCDTKGYVECKICKGKNIINKQCPECLGSKLEATNTICDHQPILQTQ